jgi:hypothetical protein
VLQCVCWQTSYRNVARTPRAPFPPHEARNFDGGKSVRNVIAYVAQRKANHSTTSLHIQRCIARLHPPSFPSITATGACCGATPGMSLPTRTVTVPALSIVAFSNSISAMAYPPLPSPTVTDRSQPVLSIVVFSNDLSSQNVLCTPHPLLIHRKSAVCCCAPPTWRHAPLKLSGRRCGRTHGLQGKLIGSWHTSRQSTTSAPSSTTPQTTAPRSIGMPSSRRSTLGCLCLDLANESG